MEEYSTSIVRKSLIRKVIMGNMPAQWLWTNVISCIAIFLFLMVKFSLFVSVFFIPIGLFFHIILNKAYAYDEQFFSVYLRHVFMRDYLPSSSRANFYHNNHSRRG